jgi:hypothetical protein
MKLKDIDVNAFKWAFIFYAVFTFFSHGYENTMFWIEVGKIRQLTGETSSMEVASRILLDPEVLLRRFLLIVLKYGLSTSILIFKAKKTPIINALIFGTVTALISTSVLALWDIKNVLDYLFLTLSENICSIGTCLLVGSLWRLRYRS